MENARKTGLDEEFLGSDASSGERVRISPVLRPELCLPESPAGVARAYHSVA